MNMSLVCAQILFYEISTIQALKQYWRLGCFYVLIFSALQAFMVLARLVSFPFFVLPLLSFLGLTVLLSLRHRFRNTLILFSMLWLSFIWLGIWLGRPKPDSFYLVESFVAAWSAAFLLPVMAAIKERLKLADLPPYFSEEGIFLLAAGFILLPFSFFRI